MKWILCVHANAGRCGACNCPAASHTVGGGEEKRSGCRVEEHKGAQEMKKKTGGERICRVFLLAVGTSYIHTRCKYHKQPDRHKSCPSTSCLTVMSTPSRGAFILIEGLDRSGKSTQAAALHARLHAAGLPVKQMKFPGQEAL